MKNLFRLVMALVVAVCMYSCSEYIDYLPTSIVFPPEGGKFTVRKMNNFWWEMEGPDSIGYSTVDSVNEVYIWKNDWLTITTPFSGSDIILEATPFDSGPERKLRLYCGDQNNFLANVDIWINITQRRK
ncbi:MAG: hypothetical protein K2N88_08820 [Muribaculaceae bacterium]|nr:hypothetical protein [Muribaculaceae bacterium]